jgi:hypothetical protein
MKRKSEHDLIHRDKKNRGFYGNVTWCKAAPCLYLSCFFFRLFLSNRKISDCDRAKVFVTVHWLRSNWANRLGCLRRKSFPLCKNLPANNSLGVERQYIFSKDCVSDTRLQIPKEKSVFKIISYIYFWNSHSVNLDHYFVITNWEPV